MKNQNSHPGFDVVPARDGSREASASTAADALSHSLQRSQLSAARSEEIPSTVLDTVKSTGQPLDHETRTLLEPRFGHDFSKIRVHTDASATQSAQAADAKAYTVGSHIVFGHGLYEPHTKDGRELLTHELTHAVQQSKSATSATSSPQQMEREAQQVSRRVMAGQNVVVNQSAPSGQMQRQARNQTSAQDKSDEFAVAESIIRGASDEKRDAKVRAVEAVWRIIHEYYPDEADKVRLVSYDDKKAGTGLRTYDHQANKTSYGEIYVGKVFLDELKVKRFFARTVLQVGHELEHIDQYRAGMRGEGKKDEREFRAFYHEALGVEKPHTGRVKHTMRIELIDTALRYYNCLDKATKDTYAKEREQLLNRREAEIQDMKNKGYGRNVPTSDPPKECRRQEG